MAKPSDQVRQTAAILREYQEALEEGHLRLAVRIENANPQITESQFMAVESEIRLRGKSLKPGQRNLYQRMAP